MTSLLSALAYSCPLILCSLGALFTEYAGCLALFMDGLVSFAAFLNYAFTLASGSAIIGTAGSCLTSLLLVLAVSAVVEKFRANRFIAAIALNLFFGALTSCLSWAIFGTRGVLAGDVYHLSLGATRAATVCVTALFVAMAVIFLGHSRQGLYLRVAGSYADVLTAGSKSRIHQKPFLGTCGTLLFACGVLSGNAPFILCSKHFQRPRLDGTCGSFSGQKKAAAHCSSGHNLLSCRYFFSKHSELHSGHFIILPDFPALSCLPAADFNKVNHSSSSKGSEASASSVVTSSVFSSD